MEDTVRTAAFTELDAATLYALLRLRVDVFVVEQRCPYPDLDGRDIEPGTRHLWIERDREPVAYLRLLDDPDGTTRIGRVVVPRNARGAGLGGRLLDAALARVGGRPCVLSAQSHLADLYARYGFAPTGPEFLEDGIPHLPMRREAGTAGPATTPSTASADTRTGRLRVGWVGTGRMGAPLAGRLLRAGHDVAVFNRTAAKTGPLAEAGATVVERPDQLAERDVVFVMVSGPADLHSVTTGPDGVLTAPGRAPDLLVDCSTVSAEASAAVREAAAARGTELLAAPVSGNPRVAEAGMLTVAISGPAEAYRRARPLLRALGRGVTYVGEGETARLVKICHNVFLGVVTQALAEVTLLAGRGGTSRAAFLEFLNSSVLGSTFTRYKTPALVNLDFSPTFTMPLLLKDLQLGLAAAGELAVPMPLGGHTAQLVASAVGAGHREEDFAALILEQARRSGMALAPENVPVDDGLGADP